MSCFIYCRVSTLEQAREKSSLADQEYRCRNIADGRKEDVTQVFIDPGVSGSTPVSLRPAGGELWKVIQPRDIIIVSKLDRLFRNATDALATADDLKKRKIDLIIADMGPDPVTESGPARMFFGMLALVAEFEKARILERTAEGRAGKKKIGGHIGGLTPYGFRKIGTGKNAMLEPDEDEQTIIDAIIDISIHEKSYREIARRLTSGGIFTRTGKEWTPTQISRVLARHESSTTPISSTGPDMKTP